MKPSELHVGVIDFFAVILPGSILTAILFLDFGQGSLVRHEFASLFLGDYGWLSFFVLAYAAGHFIFLVSSGLDVVYDWGRRRGWPDRKRNSYVVATGLRDRALARVGAGDVMSTYKWSKSLLTFKHPEAIAYVRRLEADSKFFRSFFLLLVLLAPILVVKHVAPYALGCLVLAGLAFARYAERRYKGTQWAYNFLIAHFADVAADSEANEDAR